MNGFKVSCSSTRLLAPDSALSSWTPSRSASKAFSLSSERVSASSAALSEARRLLSEACS